MHHVTSVQTRVTGLVPRLFHTPPHNHNQCCRCIGMTHLQRALEDGPTQGWISKGVPCAVFPPLTFAPAHAFTWPQDGVLVICRQHQGFQKRRQQHLVASMGQDCRLSRCLQAQNGGQGIHHGVRRARPQAKLQLMHTVVQQLRLEMQPVGAACAAQRLQHCLTDA